MKQSALIIAELKNSTIRRVTLETIACAKQLLLQQGEVYGFLSGSANDNAILQAAAHLLDCGVTTVYVQEHASINMLQQADKTAPSQHIPAIASLTSLKALVSELQPTYIIAGHTAYGRELAPRLAAALGSGYIADVTKIQRGNTADPTDFQFIRPIYAGKAFETRIFTGKTPYVLTIRPNNHQAASCNEIEKNHAVQDHAIIKLPPNTDPLRSIVRETITRVNSQIDLTEADIIVAGGRGVRGSEGFQLLQQLAEQLGGAVGASRAACDAGYCDYSMQIGQTGKVVTPQLYIACGISGAIQHLAGMSQSRTIVAINKDAEAPIFNIADYGIVGDLFEIVPLLIEELKAMQA